MKEKIKKTQKGFIPIPLLIVIIVFIITISLAATGFVLYKQGKLSFLTATISQSALNNNQTNTEEIKSEQLNKKAEDLEKQAEETKDELEKARLLAEAEKARAEAERARAEVEKTKLELEKLKKESTEVQQTPSQVTLNTPTVSGVSPSEIMSNVDETLVINGTNFRQGVAVIIGGLTLKESFGEVKYINDRMITFEYPRGYLRPGKYAVTVKNPDGLEDTFNNAVEIIDAGVIAIQENNKEIDLVSIINQWRPKIAYIKCEFRYSDTRRLYATSVGSGTVMLWSDQSIFIMTNRHVLRDQSNYGPDICYASFPNSNNVYTIANENVKALSSYDLGVLDILNPNNYINSIASTYFKRCTNKASVGEEIIILGYPGIGSQTDITATRGIISGYDGDYYITDAKIEHGNSGGAAILLKDNCYLGIPTYAISGEIESLARVLDLNAVLNYLR